MVDEPPVHADAIVLLEGGLARIPQAVSLVEQGYATRLIYPGLAPVAREPGSARELYRRERRKMLGYLLLYGWRVMP